MPIKQVWAASDTHCGHVAGLTPPKFQTCEQQGIYWQAWDRGLTEFRGRKGKIDLAVWNADLVDGRGKKSGGTELWTASLNEQVECAIEIVKHVNAKNNVFTYGTPYHTSLDGEDFEQQIAASCSYNEDGRPARISGQQFFVVNKTTFHAKHKIGSSSVPHGRFTALAKQKTWNLFWSEYEETPKADVFLRAHTHYHAYCGDDKWLAMILPASQGWGSKFGERECEGTVHFGAVGFWVDESGGLPAWRAYVSRKSKQATLQRF